MKPQFFEMAAEPVSSSYNFPTQITWRVVVCLVDGQELETTLTVHARSWDNITNISVTAGEDFVKRILKEGYQQEGENGDMIFWSPTFIKCVVLNAGESK